MSSGVIWSDDDSKTKLYNAPYEACEEYWEVPNWTPVKVMRSSYYWTHVLIGQFHGYIRTNKLIIKGESS